MGYISAHFGLELLVAEAQYLSIVLSAVKRLGAIRQLPAGPHLQVCHQLAEISLRVPRVDIENFFAIDVCVLPFAVFKEKERSFKKRGNVSVSRADDNGFFDSRLRFIRLGNLLDAADKILHEAELRHVLCLQMRKLFRKIVGIHIAVSGDQHLLAAALLDERKVAAPFVLDPYRLEMLWLRAEYYHDLRTVQSGENIGLVGRAELILQRDARKEGLEALLRELMIQVVRQHGIHRSPAACVRLLIAYKDVEGLLLLRNCKYALLNLVYGVCFRFIDRALITVCVLKS